MLTADPIIAYVDRVVEAFRPDRVVLFGSCAHGTPGPDSDVDILLVMDHVGPAHRQAARIRRAIQAPFPLELLVYRPREVERRIAGNDFFLREAMDKGLVLHAADDSRVGDQGRRRLRRRLPAAAVA